MLRREFVRKAAVAAVAAKMMIISPALAGAMGFDLKKYKLNGSGHLPEFSPKLLKDFTGLLQWMKDNGWCELIKKISGIDMNAGDPLHHTFTDRFSPNLTGVEGCNDFIGTQLISPGSPSESLLYHLLASPRVRLKNNVPETAYPNLDQIDLLENFIYGSIILDPDKINSDRMVLAVFAYEYRPACKTPHEFHADMVFARTGFSRVGTQGISSYDRVNRCFTNLPQTGSEKEIAVTPARYGLFLAERLAADKISVSNRQKGDENISFLMPVRKIFKDDLCLGQYELYFKESHKNQKLQKLCTEETLQLTPGVLFDINKAPFVRTSCSATNPVFPGDKEKYDNGMVALSEAGSSVLLSAVPKALVWRAVQNVNGKEERLRIQIPKQVKRFGLFSNRRYTSLKVLGDRDQARDDYEIFRNNLLYRRQVITDYNSPRNAPMFVNIRERVSESDGDHVDYLEAANVWNEMGKPNWVGLFEDNICDGCIAADIVKKDAVQNDNGNTVITSVTSKLLKLIMLPAFSVVTAPDFFPLVESYDMKAFTHLFLAGGVEDNGDARVRANPNINLPGLAESAFAYHPVNPVESSVKQTVVTIVSAPPKGGADPGDDARVAEADTQTRSNFLPDCATRIFFPGWDITYSGTGYKRGEQDIYFSTFGLGSPFLEDSKLCAAVNGMWAAASPDASRTYRGSLTPDPVFKRLIPTAVPLLDEELGYHPQSPAVSDHGQKESNGWDGEQGPFLETGTDTRVNFTDIGKADYVQNALHNMFDMSRLRKITVAKVRYRMSCFDRCLKTMGIRNTDVWMVGAEEVTDWSKGAKGYCIPKKLIGKGSTGLTQSKLSGRSGGFLFLCTKTVRTAPDAVPGGKRMTQPCHEVYIFQVNTDEVRYATLKENEHWIPRWN